MTKLFILSLKLLGEINELSLFLKYKEFSVRNIKFATDIVFEKFKLEKLYL